MSSDDRKAYAEGDIRSPQIPGGQHRKQQVHQYPDDWMARKRRHQRNKSRDNREALRRYHTKYKRDRKQKQRRKKYRENPSRYKRKTRSRKYERPDKTAVARRYAARPIPVDKAQLRKVAQGLVDAMVAEARKTGNGSGWDYRPLHAYNNRNGVTAQGPSVLIENPLVYGSGFVGKPLTIPVWGVTAKLRKRDPRRIHVDTRRRRVPRGGYAIWDERTQWIEIHFNARLSGAELEDSKTVDDVYSVLLHEVTHATEMVIDRALAEREANPDRPTHTSHRPDYYDIPVEVRAFMQQVADEVETAVRSGVPFRQALKESPSWQRVSPRMNQRNLKKIMKGVYTHIEGQGLPVRTASRLWYHGSPKRFEGFKTYEGHTFGKGLSEVPLFFSPSKSFAKMYATGPEGTIYTARLTWRKVFDGGDLYQDSRYWPPEYEDLTPEGKTLYDDLSDGKVFPGVDEDDLLDGYPSLWAQILRMDYDIIEDAAFKRWLKKHGYDAAYVTGDGEQNVFLFSPNQVEIVEVEGLRGKQAGDVMLYDQHNPANNEIKQPGPDVNYRAVGPTTYETIPDQNQGEPPGNRVPNRQLDGVPPATSRVIPEQMKETLRDNMTYVKGSARKTRENRISKHLALKKIYEQAHDPEGIEYGSAHVISDWGDRQWLMSYLTYTGKVRKVLVSGHVTGPGRVYLAVLPFSTRRAALLSEIMGNCGPKIRERARGLQFNRVRVNPDQGLLLYDVRGKDGDVYRVRLKGERKGNVKALAKMPLKVSCSCPAFRWQGPEHWAKKNRYLYGKPVGSASKPAVRDPGGKHWACKHVYAVLDAKTGLRFARAEPYVGRVVSIHRQKRGD